MQICCLLLMSLAELGGPAAYSKGLDPDKKIAGCWDDDKVGHAYASLCFNAEGHVSQKNPMREGSFRLSGKTLVMSFEPPAGAGSTIKCGFELDPTPNSIKQAGRTITVGWARAGSWLKLTDCDVSGRWFKSCDKLELAYGTCPRKTNNSAID
jgi:hypothetical protein